MKAVIYVRVSTTSQDRYSPEAQLENCRSYAQKRGLQVVREFREAASGWKLNGRFEFHKMLQFIKSEKIGNVVYAFADRLSRNVEDYVLLKGTQVQFHNAVTGRSFNPSDPADFDETASYEHDLAESKRFSAKLSKRVRESVQLCLKENRYPGYPPLGYKTNPATKEIEPDEAIAAHVVALFQNFATGDYSLTEITRKMFDVGFRTRTGRPVVRSQVHYILRTDFYYGRFMWAGRLYKGNYKPLIRKSLFDEAQDVLDGRKRKVMRGYDFRFKGLMICGRCGCSVVGETKHKTNKKGETKSWTYYHCTNSKGKCGLPWFRETAIDRHFEQAIDRLEFEPKVYQELREKIEGDLKLRRDMQAAEHKHLKYEHTENEGHLSVMYRDKLAGKIPEDFFQREFNKLQDRQAEIEDRLGELEGEGPDILAEASETLELAKSFKNYYLAADDRKRRKLLKILIRTCFVDVCADENVPEKFREVAGQMPLYILWNEPFRTLFENNAERRADEYWRKNREKFELRNPTKNQNGWEAWIRTKIP